uniref:HNH nuclease domain-containing protein n=1 Tax=Zea mays TaxID=4577 RepID=A0A804U6W4_MAIZE
MGGPSSPRRENDGEGSGGRSPAPATWKERPRSFDEKTRTACWRKAAVLSGRHPERWRQDAVGNVVCRRFWGCHGCLCYEYDHIVPFSKGGESTVENCQILQTRVNRSKSDKAWVAQAEMQGFSCDIMFTDKGSHYWLGDLEIFKRKLSDMIYIYYHPQLCLFTW